jgi:hypothetical protein
LELSDAPTAHATSEHACAYFEDRCWLPRSGYGLVVDSQAKKKFDTRDRALKAARELKGRFPNLQVKVFDVENKQSETIELAAA